MASTPSANDWGSARHPILVEDSDDLAGNDQEQDTDDDEPLKNRFASESTARNQERIRKRMSLKKENPLGTMESIRASFSVLIQVSHDCHRRPINQALFLEDDRTRYKMNVTKSFGSRQEKRKLLRDWKTWNEKKLDGQIAFFKFLRATKKKGKKAA
ncbi:uncharacterized protein J4E79_003487 [Alternaria viburni]|uniref:uncharacterized protein n=1 Tax=Alternaria viburni TaxID=566460 RepID=UPI0020C2C82A|nr:uncharacterized protein J4E79_003487 [Alternaria viburni]KAI4663987.1 hypothetical protein J4E79_003487 [Alternaria viburni]